MPNLLFALLYLLFFVQFSYVHASETHSMENSLHLQKDLQLYNMYVKKNLTELGIDFREFSHDIYDKILEKNELLTESEILHTQEFVQASIQLLNYFKIELDSIYFKTSEWQILHDKWENIFSIQHHNLAILEKVPLSSEDYDIFKENIEILRHLQGDAKEYLDNLQELSR